MASRLAGFVNGQRGFLGGIPHELCNPYSDVHGAGAQRSDPKTGDPARFPHGHGPQGDAIRIYDFVRLVRGAVK
jgi:hypothetical protein